MDGDRVGLLRDALRGSAWWSRAMAVGAVLRRTERPGGLLVVGTPTVEPWHITAHLADEAQWSGRQELRPTLVRWAPPEDAPTHLSFGLDRLLSANRGETILVVAPDVAPASLLERVDDARRAGATIVALDQGDSELGGLAHERMTLQGLWLPEGVNRAVSDPFDLAQHLVSSASVEGAEPTGPSPSTAWGARLLSRLVGR